MMNMTEMVEDILIAISAAEAMVNRDGISYAIMHDLSVRPAHEVEGARVLEVVYPVVSEVRQWT
jgi:hypothetical protein